MPQHLESARVGLDGYHARECLGEAQRIAADTCGRVDDERTLVDARQPEDC